MLTQVAVRVKARKGMEITFIDIQAANDSVIKGVLRDAIEHRRMNLTESDKF